MTTIDLQNRFETHLPEINRLAGFHFRHLDPDAREEAVQNATVLAWRYYLNAAKQGKHDREDVVKTIAWWAIQHSRQGRQGGGTGKAKAKCVMDYARRRKGNVVIQGDVNLNNFIGPSATIPDRVAFRLDTAAFLATLSDRNRGIAVDLATGIGTTDAAKKWGVSPGAISQFRTRFKSWHDAFHAN